MGGYLKLRISHPLDARVLAAVADPERRAVMVPEDVGVLSVFGHRKAVEAVPQAAPRCSGLVSSE
jgi:hypothetical protein